MSALRSCPRCTQALPASAAFCRRCGAAVEFSQRQPITPLGKSSSLTTPILVALLISAMTGGGVVLFGVRHTPSATVVPLAPVYTNPTSYNPPGQPVYQIQVNPRNPVYQQQVVVTPAYPERYSHRDLDDRGHYHEQGR